MPSPSPARRPVLLAGLGLACVLALAGCGGASSGRAGNGPAESSSAAATPSPSASASASASVAAATGPLLELAHARVHAPEGWERRPVLLKGVQEDAADPGAPGGLVSLNEVPAAPRSAEDEARAAIRTGGYTRSPRFTGTRMVDGVEVFRIAGPIGQGDYLEQYGANRDLTAVTITMLLPSRDYTKAERGRLVAAVLASVEWK